MQIDHAGLQGIGLFGHRHGLRADHVDLKDALAAAGMAPGNIVRLTFYTTDVDAFMGAAGELVPIFAADGCKPAATLLGVSRLFLPELMIELEATAVA